MNTRKKNFALALGALCIVATFYLLGALSIFTLFLTWNVFLILLIVSSEKSAKLGTESVTCSKDEQWSKLKKRISKAESELSKTRDPSAQSTLRRDLSSMNAEIRRLEFSIAESSANEAYAAQRVDLKVVDQKREFSGRTRLGLGSQRAQRKHLLSILDSVHDILDSEPSRSRSVALSPLENETRAHYNLIKKMDRNATILGDYWVSWFIIHSAVCNAVLASNISKYSSRALRPKVTKILNLVRNSSPNQPQH